MRYIIYPIIIILTTYIAISIYSLSFDVSKWVPDWRQMFTTTMIVTVVIDIIIELWHRIDF